MLNRIFLSKECSYSFSKLSRILRVGKLEKPVLVFCRGRFLFNELSYEPHVSDHLGAWIMDDHFEFYEVFTG